MKDYKYKLWTPPYMTKYSVVKYLFYFIQSLPFGKLIGIKHQLCFEMNRFILLFWVYFCKPKFTNITKKHSIFYFFRCDLSMFATNDYTLGAKVGKSTFCFIYLLRRCIWVSFLLSNCWIYSRMGWMGISLLPFWKYYCYLGYYLVFLCDWWSNKSWLN